VDLRICSYGSFICETCGRLRVQICATTHPYVWTSESGHICHGRGTAWRVRRQGVPNTRTHTHTHTHTHIHTHTHTCMRTARVWWEGDKVFYILSNKTCILLKEPCNLSKETHVLFKRWTIWNGIRLSVWMTESVSDSKSATSIQMSKCVMNWSFNVWIKWFHNNQPWYGVASISTLLKIIGLLCKRDL